MMLYMNCSSEIIIYFLMQNFSFIVPLTQYLGRGGLSLWFDLGFMKESICKLPCQSSHLIPILKLYFSDLYSSGAALHD